MSENHAETQGEISLPSNPKRELCQQCSKVNTVELTARPLNEFKTPREYYKDVDTRYWHGPSVRHVLANRLFCALCQTIYELIGEADALAGDGNRRARLYLLDNAGLSSDYRNPAEIVQKRSRGFRQGLWSPGYVVSDAGDNISIKCVNQKIVRSKDTGVDWSVIEFLMWVPSSRSGRLARMAWWILVCCTMRMGRSIRWKPYEGWRNLKFTTVPAPVIVVLRKLDSQT